MKKLAITVTKAGSPANSTETLRAVRCHAEFVLFSDCASLAGTSRGFGTACDEATPALMGFNNDFFLRPDNELFYTSV